MSDLVLSLLCTDEPVVVGRAIASALPHISAWCVSYNGTPGGETEDIIKTMLGHLPGELVHRPWKNYGFNRTEALQLARPWGAYALILDADEVIETWPSALGLQGADAFEVEERMGTFFNPKIRIVNLTKDWTYLGTVHEVIHCPTASVSSLPIAIRNLRDGAGSQKAQTVRYTEEAKMLEEQLVLDPTDSRARFYLAQSYELAGDLHSAYKNYVTRSEMTYGFVEEAWMALFRIAQMHMRTPSQEAFVPVACFRAWQARTSRAEPLFALARWYRQRGDYNVALMLIKQVSIISVPETDRLGVDKTVHAGGWQCLDELSLALYRTGNSQAALAICTQAIKSAPQPEHARLLQNLNYFKN